MKTSESVLAIQEAMINASKEIKNLYPGAQGYGYNYIPLEMVIDHLKGILPQHGLGYIQMPTGGGESTTGLVTRITHTSGEYIESEAQFPLTDMKGVNRSQAAGAALTYFRRYALCAAFGITGDKDIDMHGEQDVSREIQRLKDCTNLGELKTVFQELHKEFATSKSLKELVAVKDDMKKRLSNGAA